MFMPRVKDPMIHTYKGYGITVIQKSKKSFSVSIKNPPSGKFTPILGDNWQNLVNLCKEAIDAFEKAQKYFSSTPKCKKHKHNKQRH
jgi:hypothetical protein